MANWYCGTNKYALVASWRANTEYSVGAFVKQATQPDWPYRRVFRCVQAGTSGSSEPSWNLAKASTTNDNTVVWQEVTGNSAYGWSAAGPTLGLFLNGGSSWAAAGDTVYVNAGHNEWIAYEPYINSPGIAGNPVYVLCVDDDLQPADTAWVTRATFTVGGCAYSCGVNYRSSAHDSTMAIGAWTFENCTLYPNGGFGVYGISNFRNVVLYGKARDAAGLIIISSTAALVWRGGALRLIGSPAPATIFDLRAWSPEYNYIKAIEVEGVDMSEFAGSMTTLMRLNSYGRVMLKNCRLGANINMVQRNGRLGTWGRLDVINCDSGNTNYRYYRYQDAGEIFHETGVYREGGASDGTTPICRRMVSSDWAKYEDPLILGELVGWNETTGQQKTATVHLLTDGVTFTNKDLWVEVEYLGNANHPQSLFATNRPHILEAGTSLGSDNATWVHNLQNPVRQKVSLSFTPQMKGPIRVTVRLARPSTTVYVCPKVDIA